jgi:hypothetical protein
MNTSNGAVGSSSGLNKNLSKSNKKAMQEF